MSKALINFDIPGGEGKINRKTIVTFAALGIVTVGLYNWSSQIPYAGPYIDKGKTLLRKAMGYPS